MSSKKVKGFMRDTKCPPKEELEGKTVRMIVAEYGCARSTAHTWLKRNGLVKEKMLPGSVPARVLGPILQELVDDWDLTRLDDWNRVSYSDTNSGPPRRGPSKRKPNEFGGSKIEIICATMSPENRIPARTIRAIISGDRAGVTFTTADKLITFFERVDLWYKSPLKDYYWETCERPEGWDDSEMVESLTALAGGSTEPAPVSSGGGRARSHRSKSQRARAVVFK